METKDFCVICKQDKETLGISKVCQECLDRIKKKREDVIEQSAKCIPMDKRQEQLDFLLRQYSKILLDVTDRIFSEAKQDKNGTR